MPVALFYYRIKIKSPFCDGLQESTKCDPATSDLIFFQTSSFTVLATPAFFLPLE